MDDKSRRIREMYSKVSDQDTQGPQTFKCKICGQVGLQSNIIRHIRTVHPETIDTPYVADLSDGKYNFIYKTRRRETKIDPELVLLLLWKCRYGISYNAITSPLLRTAFNIGITVPSEKKLAKMVHQISNQILNRNFKLFSHQSIAITVDAGTVISQKWLAIGALYSADSKPKYQILDIYLQEEQLTTTNLLQFFLNLIEDLRKLDIFIVGVSTDNAANFVKLFGELL